jgi:hypothetical protein
LLEKFQLVFIDEIQSRLCFARISIHMKTAQLPRRITEPFGIRTLPEIFNPLRDPRMRRERA